MKKDSKTSKGHIVKADKPGSVSEKPTKTLRDEKAKKRPASSPTKSERKTRVKKGRSSPKRPVAEQIMKSKDRLFDILESISDGFFILDHKWRFTYVNKEAVRLWRRGLDELIGRSLWEIAPKAVGSVFDEQYHKAVTELVPVAFEALSPLLDVWVEVRAYPSRECLSVYFHDITERKLAQEKIFRLNRLYSVLSKINEAIVRIREPEKLYEQVCRIAVEDGGFKMAWIGLKDPETHVVQPVARWGDSGGYLDTIRVVAADVPEGRGPTGRAVYEGKYFICSDIEHDPIMRPWREKALNHGFRSSSGFPLRIGSEVTGALTIYAGQPSYFTEEEITLLVSMAEDVSFAMASIENERRRQVAEDALKRLNEELELKVDERTAKLEAANKEMEAFSYSVSHDLRAPLRIISGFSRMVLEDHADKLDDQAKNLLNIIRGNTHKMDQLINALLDLSKIGRQRMEISGIDIQRLVKSVIYDIRDNLPGGTLRIDVKTIPPAKGDHVLLRQVFENLLSNAVKFSTQKNNAAIEVGGWNEAKENVYYVRDNGIGFDMKYAGKLFGAFQRLHNSKDFEGTGIGLTIIQRIVHRHGGRVWAEGKVNEGATFFFSLPA